MILDGLCIRSDFFPQKFFRSPPHILGELGQNFCILVQYVSNFIRVIPMSLSEFLSNTDVSYLPNKLDLRN